MRYSFTTALILFMGLSIAWAESSQHTAHAPLSGTTEHQVKRYYVNTSRFMISSYAIRLQASPRNIIRLSRWLDDIFSVPHGKTMITDIIASGHRLLIRDSSWALNSSGRTLAPVSRNLTNGRGEDVVILFDARIPEQGSHWVFDRYGQRIQFTAVQNLFHELAHARHLMNGTWLYFDSEGQAIQEENLFRQQLAQYQGITEPALRVGIKGQQFWWPESTQTDTILAGL
ncbi:MAG: hypothetical protein HC808_15220 [Candidatus Competibacteraceae bacterium]|nr:hypothetical protein [Candidatus Competibacteraceae bacterium]